MNSHPPLQRFLNKLIGHSSLDEEEQNAILHLPGHPAQIQANRDFVRLGERVEHATLIVEGLVGRFAQSHEGNGRSRPSTSPATWLTFIPWSPPMPRQPFRR